MTTEEKLNHFLTASIANANAESEAIISEFTKAANETLAEHKQTILKQAEMQIKAEETRVRREANQALSKRQLRIKRQIGRKLAELKEKLFTEVTDLLKDFMTSQNYYKILEKQIKSSLAFADGDEVIIYIDPNDAKMKDFLETSTGVKITVSEYSFFGGTRTVIPSKNILIDNSFEKRLEECMTNYEFMGGISND